MPSHCCRHSLRLAQCMALLASLLFLGACGAQTKTQERPLVQEPNPIQDTLAKLEKDQQELVFRVNALEQRMLNLHGMSPAGSAQTKAPVNQALAAMETQTATPPLPKTGVAAQKVKAPYPMEAPTQTPTQTSQIPAQIPVQTPPPQPTHLPSPEADIAAGKYRLIDPNKSKGTIAPLTQVTPQRALVPILNTQVAGQTKPQVAGQNPPKKAKGKVEQEYAQALQSYRLGDYETAIKRFETLHTKYPSHALATNFLYWIGESLYALRKDIDAIFAFKNIASSYPKHPKAPDALFKAALSYRRLGDTQNANAHLRVLLEDYPNSPAAKRAKKLNQR